MKFEPMKEVLNNASYTCFSDGHKGSASALPVLCPLTEGRRCLPHVLKNIPAVGNVSMNLLVFPFQLSWLAIFHLIICTELLKHSDIVWADRAMTAEGGSTPRDQHTPTLCIMI